MKPLTRRTLFRISTRRSSITATSHLQIAHFSTSHNQSSSQYSSRRHEEETRNVRVSVWWDVESCNLPVGGTSGYRIAHSITAALRANGIRGPLQFSAFGNVSKLPRLTLEALSSSGINLTHVPGGKDGVNRSMIIDLMYWVSQHPPPAHIFMISGDHDMANILHRLRMNNYNILLAGSEDASTALCSAASIMWQWNALVKGENLVGKHFNQPPDGPSGSWYGTYRVPLESPFSAVEQPLPARDSEPAESEIENTVTVPDIPAKVTEEIKRILTTYPKGVSLAILREELSRSLIVDKNFYGYKKFSSLLLAMPQILELHPREHGQHLVRAINPKIHATKSTMKASNNSTAGNSNPTTPPTQIEVCNDNSSLKSADELCTLNSRFVTNEKSKSIEPDRQSSLICSEQQPSLKEGGQEPPTYDKVVEAGFCYGSEPTEKQDNASKDGIFRRTWTRWFGNANDDDVKREENHSVVRGPSSNHSRISDAAQGNNSNKVETSDGGVTILKFCSRLLYGFKTDDLNSESAAAGSYTSNLSSQAALHSSKNDVFAKDGFWTEMISFMGTPEGANVVSNSISRLQMARAMKNRGLSVLSSFDDDDLLHLVNILIDDKKWIKECPSKASPFKVICNSMNLLENSSDPSAMSSMPPDEPLQADVQNRKESGRSTNQIRSRAIESSEERKTRIAADVQKLLDAVVKSHPGGYSLSGFKKLFFERYSYCLQVRGLGFDKLTSLVSTMSGVKLEGEVIFPVENSSSSTPGSSDTDILDDRKKIREIESDNEMFVPSTHSDSSDSQFDEQLGPVRSLNKSVPSSRCGKQKPKTDKEWILQYEPCAEEDIYTDSDGDTRTSEGQAKGGLPKVHNEVSTLIDILSNWEARKDGASKSNLLETAPKDVLENPIKTHSAAEITIKSSRSTVHKWKPPRTFTFVSDDHKKEVDLKNSTEP